MVWYNITAYNIKVKFVLRNNKEKVICNNKNAEGVMQMKCKRNLERTIVLGLILSTGVCGSAWAADIYYHGEADKYGNSGAVIPKGDINGIDIVVDGIVSGDIYTDTTAGIVFQEDKEISGNIISIINTVIHDKIVNNDGLYVKYGSNVVVNGDKVYIAVVDDKSRSESSLFGGNNGAALAAKIGGNNNLEVSGNTVQLIGNIDFVGRDTGENNKIKVTLSSADSFWYGDEFNEEHHIDIDLGQTEVHFHSYKGELDLTLANGAEWVYNANNKISALTLENGGIVNLNDDEIKEKYKNTIINDGTNEYVLGDYRSTDPHKCVTIENLKGSGGIFKVDLDWNANQGKNYGDSYLYDYIGPDGSDYIYIEKVEGTDSKQIVDFDASKAHLENMKINKDKLYFANVAVGDTSFTTASSVYSNASNVFDYIYGTGNKGTDWYIYVSGKSAESNPNFSAAKGAMYAGYALGTELDTLNKRMGEARYLEEDDGVWVRYRHSKTGWDDTYETNSDMFQLGFDNEVTEKDGKHYRGVAIDYTDADTNIMGISGDGEHERYAVSLYDTWLGEKGHYRDLVLRGGRINSDYDISGAFSKGYEDIGGDYHQWFGSISAEWGRKNDMGTGWYFEPQVQAQLARVGGASYVSDSGVDVDQDGATSLIGRAGFRIGREYVKDNGKHDNFYIKADLLHEFAGDKSFSLTGNDGRYDKEYDGQETWCDVGIGADISLGKNSYFWADVERTFGADFDNTWQINGGFRWEF